MEVAPAVAPYCNETSRFGREHAEIAEGLFEGRLYLWWTNLPLAALGRGLGETAEFLAVGDPVGVDLKAVIAEHPLLDLLGSGGLTEHDVSPWYVYLQPVCKLKDCSVVPVWPRRGRGEGAKQLARKGILPRPSGSCYQYRLCVPAQNTQFHERSIRMIIIL